MCGRFVANIPQEELAKLFVLNDVQPLEPRYNVTPSQLAAVVRSAGDHNELTVMRWGLIPSWSKDVKIAAHTINARSETVAEKPAFRHAIRYNRCIVPVTGFYEWTHTGPLKQPHFIQLSSHAPMCLAGIWEHWNTPDGTALETFSILTTSANMLIEPMHDRMPVILRPDDFAFWLNKTMHDPHELKRLYQSFPADQMTAYRVSDLVNNPKFDSPACIARV